MTQCQQCNQTFTPHKQHPNQKYCNHKCLQKARRKIDYTKYKQHEQQKALQRYYKNREQILQKNRKHPKQQPRNCIICQKNFTPPLRQPTAQCCSQKCRYEKYKKNTPDYLEKHRIADKKYNNTDKGKRYTRFSSKKYSKRKRNWINKTKVFLTQKDYEEIKSYGRCVYCGSTTKLTHDHIIPITKKGLDHKHNCVCACEHCNNHLKNNKNAFEFCLQQNIPVPEIIYEKMQAYKNFLLNERPDLLKIIFD